MNHLKQILLIVIINVGLCIAKKKLLKSSKWDSSYSPILNEIVIQICNVCHPDYHNLIISDNDDNKINTTLLKNLYPSTTVILYQHLAKPARQIEHTQKIDAFILFISSIKRLKDKLEYFKKTSWSKPMPTFYVLHKSTHSCIMNDQILMTIWRFQIIAYFICTESKSSKGNKAFVHTFNPFRNYAPDHWKFMKRIGEKDENYFTVFARKYKKENICHQLDFDRTKNLRGYEITIAARNMRINKAIDGKIISRENLEFATDQLMPLTKIYIHLFAIILGFSIRTHIVPNWINVDAKKEIVKPIFKNTSVDIFTFTASSAAATDRNYEYSFPAYCHRLGILSHYRGYKTPFEKIRDFDGKWILLFTIFVLVVTFSVIWVNERRKFYFAAFEIIRLLVTAGIYTKMKTIPLRLYFSMVFLYFLIIHTIFSGNLVKLLTKSELRKHAESLKDLEDLSYSRIYGAAQAKFLMADLLDYGKEFLQQEYCWELILNNTSSVCVADYVLLYEAAYKYKSLYVNKVPFGFQYEYFLIRANWPLSDRVNQVLMLIWESGFREYWNWKHLKRYIFQQTIINARSDAQFIPISLTQLTFAFIIWGIGMTCATISFIVEVWIFYKQKPVLKFKEGRYGFRRKTFIKN